MAAKKKKSAPKPSPAGTPPRTQGQPGAEPDHDTLPLPVVGIGASAGGLDAFKRFFSAMPPDSGMAFVLIPHLDPTHRSLMVELLARQTAMNVCEAGEGMPIEPNRVYIIPPNRCLSVSRGQLRLTAPTERQGFEMALDGFFRSLAEDQQEKAIGIVLSGTGSHGTPGLKEIKAAGGLVMAQDPETAEYDQMPRSAIETGLIDYILPPEKMPRALLDYVRQPYLRGPHPTPAAEAGAERIAPVLDLLRTRSRYDFRRYRKNMLVRRIQRRMGICQIDEVSAYVAFLREHPEEITALSRDLLIGVTSFFRDREAFQALEQEVIPDLVARQSGEIPVRVWVPACATGEEAYSIAILLMEQFLATRKPVNIQIFASDIDEESLETARRGVYAASIVSELSPERLQQFFVKTDENHYQVSKQLRELIVVSRQNVIREAPFSKLDLISCRNLLIYLEPELQQKVLSLFHFALHERGSLFLGCSESIGRQTDLFEPVSKKWRVYRRIGPARRDLVQVPIVPDGDRRLRMPHVEAPPRPRMGFAELMQKLLLARFAPAAVLINRKYEVLSLFGRTSDYLELPSGELTRDLFSLVRQGLRTRIRAACQKVLSGNDPLAAVDARVPRNGASVACTITVSLLHEPKEAEGLLLVAFQDRAHEAPPQSLQALATEEESAVVRQLEHEVESTREDLQSTIEELQSSNEEVMSMNEELQSANEELETSKEELQSFNEELNTVNSQLQAKIDELEQAHNDIRNLLISTEIATVFLDTDLRIKRFTPATTQLLHLIETDIGRPIRDFALRFTDQTLLRDAGRVLDKLTPVETEIHSEQGRCYLRRILPYRTAAGHVEGVAIAFVDITERIQAHAQSRRLATVLRDSNDAIILLELDGRITSWNRGAERLYGYSEVEALKLNIGDLVPADDRAAQDKLLQQIARGEEIESFEIRRVAKDGRLLDIWSTITRLTGDRGAPDAIAVTSRDITERKRIESSLRESEERFRLLFERSMDAIVVADDEGNYLLANPAACQLLGYPYDQLLRMKVADLVTVNPPDAGTQYESYMQAGRGAGIFHFLRSGPGGAERIVEYAAAQFVPGQHFCILRDITERRRIEQALHDASERTAATLNAATDAIITIDDRGIIESVNLATERMFGYNASELVGQDVKLLMPSPVREQHEAYIAAYLKTGIKKIIGTTREVLAQRKDGSTFPSELSVSEFWLENQRRFVGVHRDISERKALQRELLNIASEENRRIGQDLHDSVGQKLTGLGMLAGSLAKTLFEHSPADGAAADRIATGLKSVLEQIRQLSKGLLPVEVDAEGLSAALADLAETTTRDSGVRCDFVCDKPVGVEDNEAASQMYRIAQEAVTNALKHGAPRHVKISLTRENSHLILSVRDDGKGITSAAWQAQGMGLKTMQHRAALVGATLTVAPVKNGGTQVTCRLVENRKHGKTRKNRK